MTVRTVSMQTCDRCLKPFNEKHLKAGDAVPLFKQKGLVVTETTGTSKDPEPKFNLLFSFDDICPDCQAAIENLLAKVRLEGKQAKKRGPAKKRATKAKVDSDAPKTEEYTEDSKQTEASPEKPESGSEETEKPPESPPETENPPEKAEAAAESTEENSGNGASSDKDDFLVDPQTGDKYDRGTGEVVVRGGAEGKHPF